MGGRSSSSSSSNTTTIQEDERIAATDSASVTRIDGSNNTVTDHGAIEKAGDIITEILAASNALATGAIAQSGAALESLKDSNDRTLEFAERENLEEERKTFERVAPYLLAGVSLLVLSGAFKAR